MTLLYNDKSVLLQPQGYLNQQAGSELQQQIAAIATDQHSFWIIDLSKVDFIDSAGLVALITGRHLAKRNRCRLVLCNLRPSVSLIFEITQLDGIFEIVNSPAEIPELSAQTLERLSSGKSSIAA
jgi:anti-anti-sigma factor